MSRRGWSVSTDRLGPGTAIRPRLTRRGIGGAYAVIGNPVSFTLDPVLGCLPWISLRGGTDKQSNAVRDALNAQDTQAESGAYTLPFGLAGPTAATPTTNSNAPTGGNTGPTQGKPSPTPAAPTGPFAYIRASKTGHT